MQTQKKYNRTHHFPFSPGTTNDDRINKNYWQHISALSQLVYTEKLDGENNCINQYGVFARSHAAPTQSPWTSYLREKWSLIRNDLKTIELFGENLYAIHSIEYSRLTDYFYVFAVRDQDQWLSWEEVNFYAQLLDFPTVPEIMLPQPVSQQEFERQVVQTAQRPSTFGSKDVFENTPCSMEGIVVRTTNQYPVHQFSENVFKYVRKNHVKTDTHWTRNWKKATLTQ